MDEHPESITPGVQVILTNLSQEISRPLDLLESEIRRLLEDESTATITEAERSQATAMIALCEDISRLTRESLGPAGPSTR